ncbi:chromatin assembly factor 1 subunit B [Mytilus galloprovincialis]|nr:chromatin assembly factor 1 subunit B [Mytilus galloprovincialis]
MKVTTPEISWHERDPIYSVDFQPGNRKVKRIATTGVDKFIRIWEIKVGGDGKGTVEFISNLKRHTKSVNVCRFSPDGEVLATAGDDSVIVFWKLSDVPVPQNNIFNEDEEDNKENWTPFKMLRGHLEDVYDLCWSADGKRMISGSVDNTAIVWDIVKGEKVALFNDHKSFVQGVAFDPSNEFVATLSTDRSLRIFNLSNDKCLHTVSKMSLPQPATQSSDSPSEIKPKSFKMFHDDTMRSFFRRLTFTQDGEILIVPAGCIECGDKLINSTYMFSRQLLTKPSVYLPSPNKVTVCVRCCPQKFELKKISRQESGSEDQTNNNNLKEWEKYLTMFSLPYRTVFAVGTEDSVLFYDTQQQMPFAHVTNIHYHQISDLAWCLFLYKDWIISLVTMFELFYLQPFSGVYSYTKIGLSPLSQCLNYLSTGKVAQPFSGVYSSTKFALDGFFGSIRQEFALRNCDVSITLCVIGLVGTESAISELRNFGQHFLLKYIKAAEPPDAAYAIIRGGALRAREIYFPYMETRVLTLLRDLLPRTVDYINRWVYTTS